MSRDRTSKPKETRKAFVSRVHTEVDGARTIHDLWTIYFHNRFEIHESWPAHDPEVNGLLKEVFYSGVASMFQLFNKAIDSGVSVDEGAAAVARIHEELEIYEKSLP